MTLPFAIALYFIIWWITLFAMLPIGVRTSEEAGEKTTPGNAESAPHTPNLLPKMVATTVVASIVFAALYAVIVLHIITHRRHPVFPALRARAIGARQLPANSRANPRAKNAQKKARPNRPCFSNSNSLISLARAARPSVSTLEICWLKSGCAVLARPELLPPKTWTRSNLNA